jgi:hypothetical protein
MNDIIVNIRIFLFHIYPRIPAFTQFSFKSS